MILYRCFAHREGAESRREGGPLWFRRSQQGAGRHDNPGHYGCLYLSDREVSGVIERLVRFRGEPGLAAWMLTRESDPLAIATIELDDASELVDLDDPVVLSRARLRPSLVATHQRETTQPQALRLYHRRPDAAGLRWWSTFESLWANVTVFDRAASAMRLLGLRELKLDDQAVVEAANFLGFAA